ncbi:MAG: beta-propeller domain-containing protein [Brevundimonas sp.]|uniref:beta-propeller domain-containing protein n=1 Tax=Brevundimonas sp. TaxID=1871086 RepID=UPI002AB9B850|nr:beta-propeller domain-containing protein [Brevundimonas sp.]MDZ4110308.1 beta-propeller domain-containing protein [Brevundimonas sp.]
MSRLLAHGARAAWAVALVWLLPGIAAAQEGGLQPFSSGAELSNAIQVEPLSQYCDEVTGECVEEIVVTGSRVTSAPSITNNQEAGVDEGDIVKAIGDTLVILRRGRLFTVDTYGGGLRAMDRIDAYPPGIDGSEGWYDEMLVADNWIVVIGYSYERGGTEINRFLLGSDGEMTFVDSYLLKSEDYYSSRNYASRLIGRELVTYAPVEVRARDPLNDLPALVRWVPGQGEHGFGGEANRIMAVGDVYRTAGPGEETVGWDVLHTVIRCDLTAVQFQCRGSAVLGPYSRNFYVSATAVYVWVTDRGRWSSEPDDRSWLFRVPLDGSAPGAAATRGTPIDQFSFNEVPEAGRIDVLTVSEGNGEAMWGSEVANGEAALLSLPFTRFGTGTDEPVDGDYRVLPRVAETWRPLNRFVGSHLLYAFSVWDEDLDDVTTGVLTVVPLDGGDISRMAVAGQVGRIEAMGEDAMVTSEDKGALIFTTVDLGGVRPRISDQYVLEGGEESESRSHAFFFQPDRDSTDGARGVLGLPVLREVDEAPDGRYRYTDGSLGTVVYLRRGDSRVRPLGSLDATPGISRVDDGCVASCVDWYGDARPIFLNGRVFALLGYELVEGRESGGRMRELRRIDMTPPTPPGPRPYYLDY